MSTLAEIESAARQLTPEERRRLLISVAQSLREEGQVLPKPRRFSAEEMQAWLDGDERDLKRLRSKG